MKKNKKEDAEITRKKKGKKGEAQGEVSAPEGKVKQVVNMNDIDDEMLSITKSEPVPYPVKASQPVPRPQQMPQAATPYDAAPDPEIPVDAAILKPVPGGLQPIIAPKGTVQLSPVVVPVAFVPYSTQNQPLLQFEKKGKPAPVQPDLEGIKDQPLDKGAASAAKKVDGKPEFVGEEEEEVEVSASKKTKTKNRIFASILFVVLLGYFAFVVLNYFAGTLGITSLALAPGQPEIISGWMNFDTGDIVGQIPLFIFTVAAAIALATLITCFVSICNGRGYHIWIAGLIMLVVTAVGTLLCAFDILHMEVSLNPIVENSFAWRLVFVSLLLVILGLIFMPRKPKIIEDDDDLSDLI